MSKKNSLIFFLSAAIFISLITFSYVSADDDDEYETDDYIAPVETQIVSPASTKKTKTVTQTVVVSPERIVTENQMQTISLSDRDHDGIPDSEDPHQDIAEIYIVKDDNLNGIVDTFEYGK